MDCDHVAFDEFGLELVAIDAFADRSLEYPGRMYAPHVLDLRLALWPGEEAHRFRFRLVGAHHAAVAAQNPVRVTVAPRGYEIQISITHGARVP
jgi:hypothetical protein